MIEWSAPKGKERIRDAIRLLPQGESKWTRLQAVVYGPRMSDAAAFEGSEIFLRHCSEQGTKAVIVSHKTHFVTLDGKQIDLRDSALTWMKARKFFDADGCGVSLNNVFFESTRSEKIERIRTLGCTHFIDDLAEVFAESSFPRDVAKLLFAPHGANAGSQEIKVFRTWRDLDEFFFYDKRR